MGIINDPDDIKNRITDPFTDYHGKINIEYRGASSLKFDKKSYSLETQDENGENLNVALMGMPEENDWVLYAPYSDKSLLRNVLTYHLARKMGQYASRTQFCELILNAEYRGIYVFMEKIKCDKNRIDISKLRKKEVAGDDVTGGYIIKIDEDNGPERGWESKVFPLYQNYQPIFFQYHYPEYDEIMPEQQAYIQNFVQEFETVLVDSHFSNPETGYTNYVNLQSFIDHFIINEFAKNIDAFRRSVYLYKDKNSVDGRLVAGPVWDFNLAYGNFEGEESDAYSPEGWMFNQGGNRMFWWVRMMQDELFKIHLRLRWQELRRDILKIASLFQYIDEMRELVQEAQERNFTRWPILGQKVWPNHFVGDTYQEEVDYLKQWIYERISWMDKNMAAIQLPDDFDEDHENENDNKNLQTFTLEIYPNPFINNTTIKYELAKPSHVNVQIYNVLGQAVKTLLNTVQHANEQHISWDGTDKFGNIVPGGLYICVLKIDWEIRSVQKFIKM